MPDQKAEDVASFAAPEAVEDLPIGIDVEGGGLLVVEGAKALETVARLLERDVVADDLCDGRAVADLSNLCGNAELGIETGDRHQDRQFLM